jgi:hypothetical protein
METNFKHFFPFLVKRGDGNKKRDNETSLNIVPLVNCDSPSGSLRNFKSLLPLVFYPTAKVRGDDSAFIQGAKIGTAIQIWFFSVPRSPEDNSPRTKHVPDLADESFLNFPATINEGQCLEARKL